MAERKLPFIVGEYFHLYNRGNSKQEIFLDDNDRDRFTKLLYLCNSQKSIRFREDIVEKNIDAWDFDRGTPIVSLGAWVIMPNHFHLYISPRTFLGEDDISVSIFMKKICTGYSMYFNKKYERTGALFEGKFKSTHMETDEQAKYNFSYIHLNPVKLIDSNWRENKLKDNERILDFLESYKWSSYHDYRGKSRPENKILSKEDFPGYFSDGKTFDDEIFDWFEFNDEQVV